LGLLGQAAYFRYVVIKKSAEFKFLYYAVPREWPTSPL
jgi:hypothetical protein